MSITTYNKHHKIDESQTMSLQKSCEEPLGPTKLEFNDDILSIEYNNNNNNNNNNTSQYGFRFRRVRGDVDVSLDVDLCAEYESFSFDPIQTDLLFDNYKSEFVESESIATENFALDYTHAHFDANRLVDFAPTILPRPLIQMIYFLGRWPTCWLLLSTSIYFLIAPNSSIN